MVCAHCSGMTCYLCNTKLYYKEGKGKYWHFAGHEFSDPDAVCTIWNNIANDNVVRYVTSSYTEFDTYNTMQIKVVLLSESTHIIPKVEQIQVIGVSA